MRPSPLDSFDHSIPVSGSLCWSDETKFQISETRLPLFHCRLRANSFQELSTKFFPGICLTLPFQFEPEQRDDS